jgi:hypothetical protein
VNGGAEAECAKAGPATFLNTRRTSGRLAADERRNRKMARCLESNHPDDLTRCAIRETMEVSSEVKIWIWGYRDA